MRILVLGAGFGGLELTTSLSEALGDDAEITLIERSDHFVFGFSKLDVMFGRAVPEQVIHPYAGRVKPGVTFVQTTITSIDPTAKRVETEAGTFEADLIVVALGADLHPDATPGLLEGGHEFYTVPGAFALRDVLAGFGGGRVVVAVTSTPFKCPPAPSETALLMHDFLTERGLRDSSEIALVMPMGAPIPPSPDASKALLTAFEERGIAWHPERIVTSLDPARKVAVCADGTELPYDLFLGVPVHRAPVVVQQSGMCVGGWIPVDPLTLETSFPGVYAVGDVTSAALVRAREDHHVDREPVRVHVEVLDGDPTPAVRARGEAATARGTTTWRQRAGGPTARLGRAGRDAGSCPTPTSGSRRRT